MTKLSPRCKNCEHWLPFEPGKGICKMGHAPEPLVWLNLTFYDEKGDRHEQVIPNPELHTDPEFGCILFEPSEGLLKIQKLQEELDGCDESDGDEYAL